MILFNLLIIFIEHDSYNIILNAMAFHAIVELKEVVKAVFLKSFPPDFNTYMTVDDKENEREGEKNWFSKITNIGGTIIFIILALFCVSIVSVKTTNVQPGPITPVWRIPKKKGIRGPWKNY